MKPELVEQVQLLQVKLILHIQNEPINEPINERQKTILMTMAQFPQINRNELSHKTMIPLITLRREIEHLREIGCIEREGSKKSGRWIVKKPFNSVNGQINEDALKQKENE